MRARNETTIIAVSYNYVVGIGDNEVNNGPVGTHREPSIINKDLMVCRRYFKFTRRSPKYMH